MPFLFSLFCRQGRDSRLRTIAIAVALCAVMLWGAEQAQKIPTWLGISALFVLTVVSALIAWAGAERRLNDSLRSNKLAWPVLGLWFSHGVAHIFLPASHITFGLSVLALLSLMRLAWFVPHYKAAAFAPGHKGRLGYSGPSKLGTLGTIEPLLEPTRGFALTEKKHKDTPHSSGELSMNRPKIWNIFPQEPKLQMIGIIGLFSLLFGLFWPHKLPLSALTQQILPTQETKVPNHQHYVWLSEQLELFMQDHALIIRWIGGEVDEGKYWSLATGQGDQRCAEMVFDNDRRYRPLQIDVAEDGFFYARFSPLDTSNLLYDIAQQKHVTLCEHRIFLAGSKEHLRQHPTFSALMFESLADLYPPSSN